MGVTIKVYYSITVTTDNYHKQSLQMMIAIYY